MLGEKEPGRQRVIIRKVGAREVKRREGIMEEFSNPGLVRTLVKE